MIRRLVLFTLALAFLSPAAVRSQTLGETIGQLTQSLSKDVEKSGLNRIGVPEFVDSKGSLGGDTGAAGRYVAEKVEESLVKDSRGQYELIERRRLNAVLQELNVQATGLTDEATSQALASKIKGLDGIIVGSLTRVGSKLDVTCKLVRLPEATIESSQSGSLLLDPDLLALFGENFLMPAASDDAPPTLKGFIVEAISSRHSNSLPQTDSTSQFTMDVLVGGNPKTLYRNGNSVAITARKGEVYQIRLTNKGTQTVGVALFIDGLNTLYKKRELASTGKKWVVAPGSSVTIEGWQEDKDTARKFVFSDAKESLAARQHFTEEMGIITATFFPEQTQSGEEVRGLGTAEGESVGSAVTEVDVQFRSVPAAILTLRYGSASEVEKGQRISR